MRVTEFVLSWVGDRDSTGLILSNFEKALNDSVSRVAAVGKIHIIMVEACKTCKRL